MHVLHVPGPRHGPEQSLMLGPCTRLHSAAFMCIRLGLPWTLWLHHHQGVRASHFSSDPPDAGLTEAASNPCRATGVLGPCTRFSLGVSRPGCPPILLVSATGRSTSPSDPSGGVCGYFKDKKPITCPDSLPSNSLQGNAGDRNVLAGVECVVRPCLPESGLGPQEPPGRGSSSGRVPRATYCSLSLILKQN